MNKLILATIGALVLIGLASHSVSAEIVELTWTDNSENEVGFNIERSLNGSAFDRIASTGANITNYVDSAIASNSSYVYRVNAYNDFAESEYTNNVSYSNINTVPTISYLDDASIYMNATLGPIYFSINDAETSSSDLVLSATSSNTDLVDQEGIVLDGSAESRSLTLFLIVDILGSSIITLTVSDGNLSASESFTVTVIPYSPPVISIIYQTRS